MCLFEVCSPYIEISWPSTYGNKSCSGKDHSGLTTVGLYAYPAWWGFTDAADRSRLERLLAGLRRWGYLPEEFPFFVELTRSSDSGLFKSISSNPDHVLRHNLSDKKPSGHNLHVRTRAHGFALPIKDSRNVVSSILYGTSMNEG